MAGKSLRWQNFPVPEAHLIGLVVGAVLERVRPLHRRPSGPTARLSGLALAAAGAGLALWATRSAGNTDLARPERLVIAGPYSRSRHPMYVAWTGIYIGVSLLTGSGWSLALLPLVMARVHLEASAEERRMQDTFGSAYADYAARVRRYL